MGAHDRRPSGLPAAAPALSYLVTNDSLPAATNAKLNRLAATYARQYNIEKARFGNKRLAVVIILALLGVVPVLIYLKGIKSRTF
jgi:hypothetical protein